MMDFGPYLACVWLLFGHSLYGVVLMCFFVFSPAVIALSRGLSLSLSSKQCLVNLVTKTMTSFKKSKNLDHS